MDALGEFSGKKIIEHKFTYTSVSSTAGYLALSTTSPLPQGAIPLGIIQIKLNDGKVVLFSFNSATGELTLVKKDNSDTSSVEYGGFVIIAILTNK